MNWDGKYTMFYTQWYVYGINLGPPGSLPEFEDP